MIATFSDQVVVKVPGVLLHTPHLKHIPPRLHVFFLPSFRAAALDNRPVFTKSVSSGLIGLLGDLLAQSVEWGLGGGAIPWSGTKVRPTSIIDSVVAELRCCSLTNRGITGASHGHA